MAALSIQYLPFIYPSLHTSAPKSADLCLEHAFGVQFKSIHNINWHPLTHSDEHIKRARVANKPIDYMFIIIRDVFICVFVFVCSRVWVSLKNLFLCVSVC